MKQRKHRAKYPLALLSIGMLLGALTCSTEYSTPFTLPKPAGPFAIGIKNLFLVDENRPETFTPDPDDHREISAIIWYPAEKPEKGKPVSFMEHHQEKTEVFKRFAPLPDSVFELISRITTHSYRDAPLAKGEKSFPLLVFSHAYWAGITQSTVLMQELASHGYVVVSVAHPYETPYLITAEGSIKAFDPMNEEFKKRGEERKAAFPFQAQISQTLDRDTLDQLIRAIHERRPKTLESVNIWMEDVRFIIDELEKMNQQDGFFNSALETERIGVFGHSFGGAVSGQACLVDDRIKAGINMDGLQLGDQIEQNLTKPFMFMHHDNIGAINKTPNLLFFERAENEAYLIVIEGSRHLNFSDISLPGYGELLQLPVETLGPLEGNRCLKIINAYAVAFFDKHLKKEDSGLLDGPSSIYPEVEITVRNEK